MLQIGEYNIMGLQNKYGPLITTEWCLGQGRRPASI